MMTKITAALLLSTALMAPSFASAQDAPAQDSSLLEQSFANRGACESTLKRGRNEARQTVKQNGGSGQTNALINRLANPAIKFICTAATQDGKSVFKIVES